eukprot:TRINITY_DN85538_c0_g1_i1.p1 TRINITY_DN85538_c0_g1~~TRINITY_DN85538_c0_g1_i1.p1  ORF type:complete len:262 (+),score=33.57 TRINITY_DN85538_c0_g1_i1:36-821(+)
MSCKGKVALVTGSASGIGKAIAIKLAQEGATVVVSDINEEAGKKVAEDLGEPAVFMKLNVCEEQEWNTVVDAIITKFGSWDILINNAGVGHPSNLEEVKMDDWMKTYKLLCVAPMVGCSLALKKMKEKGGSIVNIASLSAVTGFYMVADYGAAKAAISNATMSVAAHCTTMKYPIRCNAVQPAFCATPLVTDMLPKEMTALKESNPNLPEGYGATPHVMDPKYLLDPSEVANVTVFLASDAASGVNGSLYTLDKGWHATIY